MTDARFPERWLNDRRIQSLSDRDHRSFVNVLVWCVANRTDGVIVPGDVELIPRFSRESIGALVAAELWEVDDDGREVFWRVAGYELTQATRDELDQLERARLAERQKKRRQRAEKNGSATKSVPGTIPGTVPGDVRGTTQDRTGQDRHTRNPEGVECD